ncbi:MAG: hypothetical protein ACFB50_04665 [Rubrobacteraceae bacterium]
MALIERTAYPRFGRSPSKGDPARLYAPTLREIDLARRATRGGEGQQLAFLVIFGGEGVLSDTDPGEQEKRMKFKELLTG